MKVLILSCSAGGGHDAAARVIGEELGRQGVEYLIRDALDFVPKARKLLVEKGHTLAYKYIPHIYGAGYLQIEKMKNHRAMYLGYAGYTGKISRYIQDNGFNTAICVHEFPAFMLTSARRKKLLSIRQYFLSTDYSVAPGLELTDMDGYFVPKGFRDAFLEKVPGKAVIETGIPVAPKYYEERNRQEVREDLGLPRDADVALLAAGSIGCGPIRKVAETLLADGDENRRVVVLCGNNRSLQRDLSRRTGNGRLIPLGFTDRVPDWMAASDIMISKAGGLSTTEAASEGIPLVLINAVGGLEEKNLRHFVDNGYAVTAKKPDGICRLASEFLSSKEAAGAMLERQKAGFHENAVEQLCTHVIKDRI